MITLTGRSFSLWIAALTVSAFGAAAHAEDAVVIASTQRGYLAGAPLMDGQTLTLAAGAGAVLLFRSGGIVRVKGPFEGRLDLIRPRGAASGVVGLVEALQSRGVDASVIGATRELFEASFVRAELDGASVQVDVQRSATYCLGAHDTVWLQGAPALQSEVRLRQGERVRRIGWQEGARRIPWPDDVAIEDGDRFELIGEGRGAPVTVVFRRLPLAPSAAAWAAAGSLAGCKDQVEPELRQISAAIEEARPDDQGLWSSGVVK